VVSNENVPMRSSRPYLLRAIYEWLTDDNLTPYIVVDAMVPHVRVPERFIEDGKIVLNIAPHAVHQLHMGNDAVQFSARFAGLVFHIYLPIQAITAIYAVENGHGMVFSEENEGDINDNGDDDGGDDGNVPPKGTRRNLLPKEKKPHLRIVK